YQQLIGNMMPSLLKLFLPALLAVITTSTATASQATELTLTTDQGFELKVDYYEPENLKKEPYFYCINATLTALCITT
ncbi:MAG: hypothetical protein COA91_01570, partial [Robiginitomaculum sp.]